MEQRKKKIGLITIYHVPNYGSVLQAYATQVVLEQMGYECVMLNYRYPNEWHFKRNPQARPRLKTRIGVLLGLTPRHRKMRKLESFRRQYFHFSKVYADLEALEAGDWYDFDAFVVGSDQVWNSRFSFGDSAFMLSFVPGDKRMVSVASSFASKHIPESYIAKYKKYLSRFSDLSVRERNGKDIIEKDLAISRNVEVVLDPTLFLGRDDWAGLFPQAMKVKAGKPAEERYILLYVLAYAFEPRPYVYELVKYYSEKYNLKVFALEGYEPSSRACGVEMRDCTEAGAEQCLELFANAEMVITTSFHGTAFAVNFGIPLVSVVPNDGRGDDRQSSLLRQLDLLQCIAPVGESVKSINPFYNVEKAQSRLSELRERSLTWISKALS